MDEQLVRHEAMSHENTVVVRALRGCRRLQRLCGFFHL
jgi:hypothetical protein